MFPCTSCGLCCQNITGIDELKEYDLGNGICKYFNGISNQCKIYTTRPRICQIETMFEVKYNKYYTKKEFYTVNAKACNSLQISYGINEDFKVNIKD